MQQSQEMTSIPPEIFDVPIYVVSSSSNPLTPVVATFEPSNTVENGSPLYGMVFFDERQARGYALNFHGRRVEITFGELLGLGPDDNHGVLVYGPPHYRFEGSGFHPVERFEARHQERDLNARKQEIKENVAASETLDKAIEKARVALEEFTGGVGTIEFVGIESADSRKRHGDHRVDTDTTLHLAFKVDEYIFQVTAQNESNWVLDRGSSTGKTEHYFSLWSRNDNPHVPHAKSGLFARPAPEGPTPPALSPVSMGSLAELPGILELYSHLDVKAANVVPLLKERGIIKPTPDLNDAFGL